MRKTRSEGDVSIGKFDILATYAYAHALVNGMDDHEAKQRGMVAAIMGARAVKRLVKIPATWGAKISEKQFKERTSGYLEKGS